MMVPVIPTTEVQLTVLRVGPQRTEQAVVLCVGNKIPAQKNAGGMHLVFRYVSLLRQKLPSDAPAIEVSFPDQPAANDVFLPLCGSYGFLSSGIRLQRGQWVTLEVKPTIGLEPGSGMELPFDVWIAGSPTGSGRPDEPVILIHC